MLLRCRKLTILLKYKPLPPGRTVNDTAKRDGPWLIFAIPQTSPRDLPLLGVPSSRIQKPLCLGSHLMYFFIWLLFPLNKPLSPKSSHIRVWTLETQPRMPGQTHFWKSPGLRSTIILAQPTFTSHKSRSKDFFPEEKKTQVSYTVPSCIVPAAHSACVMSCPQGRVVIIQHGMNL